MKNITRLEDYGDIMTAAQVGELLHLGKAKVYELLKSEKIGHMKIGRKYLIPKKYVEIFLGLRSE